MRSVKSPFSFSWRSHIMIRQLRLLAKADSVSRRVYMPYALRKWIGGKGGSTAESFEGRSIVERGTPPTPADPFPSNRVVTKYPDGSVFADSPHPNQTVLSEYAQAITAAPAEAGLRIHYGLALHRADQNEAAVEQIQEALRLDPQSGFAHRVYGCVLEAQGQYTQAAGEYRQDLTLSLPDAHVGNTQNEAQLRWSLARALRLAGRQPEARIELAQAIALQRRLVSERRGSPEFLERLEADSQMNASLT